MINSIDGILRASCCLEVNASRLFVLDNVQLFFCVPPPEARDHIMSERHALNRLRHPVASAYNVHDRHVSHLLHLPLRQIFFLPT